MGEQKQKTKKSKPKHDFGALYLIGLIIASSLLAFGYGAMVIGSNLGWLIMTAAGLLIVFIMLNEDKWSNDQSFDSLKINKQLKSFQLYKAKERTDWSAKVQLGLGVRVLLAYLIAIIFFFGLLFISYYWQ